MGINYQNLRQKYAKAQEIADAHKAAGK